MTYTTESINKTIDLCREEMAKSDALPPTLKQLMELILQILMFLLVKTTPRNSSKKGKNQGVPQVVKKGIKGPPFSQSTSPIKLFQYR